MTPSGHKAFLVRNVADVDLLLMHNRTFAAEYVSLGYLEPSSRREVEQSSDLANMFFTGSHTTFPLASVSTSSRARSSSTLRSPTPRLGSRRRSKSRRVWFIISGHHHGSGDGHGDNGSAIGLRFFLALVYAREW